MSLRFFLVGIVWLGIMILLFATDRNPFEPVYFNYIPSRAIIHGIFFLGFVHIWTCACKKQYKYDVLRRKAFGLILTIAIFLALFSEVGFYLLGIKPCVNGWNLAFDFTGAMLGLLTFRMVYASSY